MKTDQEIEIEVVDRCWVGHGQQRVTTLEEQVTTLENEVVELRQRVSALEAESLAQYLQIEELKIKAKAVHQFILGMENLVFQR